MCQTQELLSLVLGFACACTILGSTKLKRIGVVVIIAECFYRISGLMA